MSNGKKLVRKTEDRMIAGVSAGIADYFNMDVTLIRVLFVITTIFGGAGLVVYIVMWILVPEEGTTEAVTDQPVDTATEEIPPETTEDE